MSRKPTKYIDYTSRDYAAYKELLKEKLVEKIPEYTDTSETDMGIAILEAFANGLDIMSLYADIVANDVILPTTQDRKMAVIIARCLGYHAFNQKAAEFQQVFVLSEVQETDVIIPKGTVVRTQETADLETLEYETQDDLVIPAGSLGDEKEDGKYLYTVRIIQGNTINQDILGTSSGNPLQSFKLGYEHVLVDSIKLYVDEGEGKYLWTQVNSFLDCNENSRAYTVSVDEFDVCTVEFGNGVKGKIPVSYPSGITTTYRIGGGSKGNVGAGVINELSEGIPFVEGTFNLEVSVPGYDKENIESIKVNAPAAYRSRDRLVTTNDYEDLLRMNFLPFLRVKGVRDAVEKKRMHLFYLMKKGYTFDFADKVAEYIGSRSMIGTVYDINPCVMQSTDIEAKMYVDPDYDKDTVSDNVKKYLADTVFAYGNLLFGDTIVKSDLESEIKNTLSGVMSFRIDTPSADIISPASPQNILSLGTVTINAVYPDYS